MFMNTRMKQGVLVLLGIAAGWCLNSLNLVPLLQGQERRGDPGKSLTPTPTPAPTKSVDAKVSTERFSYQDINYTLSARNASANDVRKLNVDFMRDSKTGNMLYLSADNGQLAVVPGQKNFEFHEISYTNKSLETIRTSPRTGEAWSLKWANNQATWTKFEESGGPPPEGDYVFFLFEAANNSYYLDRFDRVSGKGWILTNLRWVPVE